MQRDKRSWTSEQKLQAIMAVIRGEVSLPEQSRRLKVAESQLYRWRDQACTRKIPRVLRISHHGEELRC